jgi:hypothetical protein
MMFNDSLFTTKRCGMWECFHLFAMKLLQECSLLLAQLAVPIIYRCMKL